jgi:hypothetical protein
MVKKVYSYSVNFYSGFKASETKYYKFDSLLDAYEAYKKSRKYDFAYDDGTYYSTERIHSYFVFVKDENHRPDSRSFTEILEEEEDEYIFDKEEEDEYISDKDEYIFDKDEYIF